MQIKEILAIICLSSISRYIYFCIHLRNFGKSTYIAQSNITDEHIFKYLAVRKKFKL